MLSFDALARDRSTFACLALVLAFAAGPAGLVSAAAADDAPQAPAATTPAPTTPTGPTTPDPTPAPTPAVDPAAATDEFGPVSASAVVLPGPNLVPIAERIAPVKPGPSLRFVSAGHGLLVARMKTMNVKLRFDGPAQEALLRFLKVTVTVRLEATDAKGNVKTVEQSVALSD